MTGSHADEIVSDFFESDDWAEELLEDAESEPDLDLPPLPPPRPKQPEPGGSSLGSTAASSSTSTSAPSGMSAPRSRSCSPDPHRQTLRRARAPPPPVTVGREEKPCPHDVCALGAQLGCGRESELDRRLCLPIGVADVQNTALGERRRATDSDVLSVADGSRVGGRLSETPAVPRPFAARQLYILVPTVTEMRLYDLRVTVERIEGRSVCGLEVGDYFEVTESSRIRIPEGRHFCMYALQSVLPLLPAKQRQLPGPRLARAGLARLLPRPRRTGRHADRTNRRACSAHRRVDMNDGQRELGLGLQTDKQPGEYGPLARAAEEAGFAVVTTFNDLWFQPALPALLEIASSTQRVRIGPSCLNPFTVHPVEIAGQIAMLDAAVGRPRLPRPRARSLARDARSRSIRPGDGDSRDVGSRPPPPRR